MGVETEYKCIQIKALRKKWSQKGASEEPFWKTPPFCKEDPFFLKKRLETVPPLIKKRSQNSAANGSVLQTKMMPLISSFGSSFLSEWDETCMDTA